MHVLLSTYGSRGDVEPMVGLAAELRALGAEVRVCAPPDFAERLAEVGVPLVPVGRPVRAMVTGATPPSAAEVPRRAAALVAAQFDTVAAAAEGCDALVATGVMPAGARSVAEKLGIRSVSASYQPVTLPSPHHPPQARPGRPFPLEVTDNRVLWDLDAQSVNALFGAALNTHRASIGLPPVDNVCDHVIGEPWLAADPTLGPWQEPTDLDVVQTGAWILPDVRPLPAELVAFLDAGTPPVYVGFGSMAMQTPALRAPKDIARVAIEAIRAQGRRALVHERPPWPARSAPTGRRWPRRCCSTRAASVRVNHAGSSSRGKCRNRTRSLVVRATLTKRWASSGSNGQAGTITSSPSTRHDYNANVP